MEINEYQEKSKRTLPDLGSCLNNNIHMSLGLVTESAEIADIFKKQLAYNNDPDLVNIKEEIVDIMFYIVNLCNINGWDIRDILQNNIAKLKQRYPEKFNIENALNRDLDAERKILEG